MEKAEAERRGAEKAGVEPRSTPQPSPVPRPSDARAARAKRRRTPLAWVGVFVVLTGVAEIGAVVLWLCMPHPHPSTVRPAEKTQLPLQGQTPTTAPAAGASNLPTNPASRKAGPAQFVVQTSPQALVYLDDKFQGEVSPEGSLVIVDVNPGDHALRVWQAGKKDYEQQITVGAGQTATVTATPGAAEQPPPPVPVVTPPQPISVLSVGTVRENPRDGRKYVWIPPGTFMMGCSAGDSECNDDERPAHQVTITRGFWIGQTPVTVGAYKRFVDSSGGQMPSPPLDNGWANENVPVVNVAWVDAQVYCGWLGGRLPTEAEWEYAARGGSTESRYGDLEDIAWYYANSGRQAHEVGQKHPNGFGLYDMLGNVWEWVNDWYAPDYYQNSPPQDPLAPSGGPWRVIRGGSWNNVPRNARFSQRGEVIPDLRGFAVGFRCAVEEF